MRRWLPGVMIAATVLAAGCSSSSSTGSSSTTSSSRVERVVAQPVDQPSTSAKMVCADEAQKDIASNLGAKATLVTVPTWADQVYSCQYVYPNGSVSLAVKELPDSSSTTTYFNGLSRVLGRRPGTLALGQGAFVTTNGSVVVRKDHKVLTVDASKMPAQFGQPPETPDQVSLAVASTVMGCWTGS